MAHSVQCFLPKFSPLCEGPRRPMSMRTRTTQSQTDQLMSAWRERQLDALLQTTWALVLNRYTGSGDICFGFQNLGVDGYPPRLNSPSAIAKIETYRLAIHEHESIPILLGRAKSQVRLVDSAGTSDGSSALHGRFLLYNTILMVRDCSESTKALQKVPIQPITTIALPDECRVRLHVKLLRGDIGIFLEWWNDEMSAEQMKSISCYFYETLSRVLAAEDVPAGQLKGLSDNDWSRICKFNAVYPESFDTCIHEVIYERSLLQPEKEAVCAWDGRLTYGELILLASQVAYYLQGQGVGPEALVALCFDKSKWNVVAMLGVMMAGGAFVPLDPTHPTSRLRSLVKSVQTKIMLCSRNHFESLRDVTDTLLPLDRSTWDELSLPKGRVDLLKEVKGCNAAYVIFTSGSTGEPKGTLMEHRSYVSSAMAHAPRILYSPDSRSLQFAAHTFDASLIETLTPLIKGGCVCVPSEEARLNDIVGAMNDMRVNHATFTPSFIDFINPSDVPGLKALVLAGEAMSQSHLETWSMIDLVNGFGPTETAVTSAVNSRMTRTSDCRDIGLPTGGLCWIVDSEDHDQLVPIGCVGEMLVEGPTLARGYVNNQQKTDEVFIYDPEWTRNTGDNRTGRRFYKTGDLVRYNSETGSLTYIGRKDTQVKFHGQRIELGEIEDNLNADATIKHCLVFLPRGGIFEGKLVAVISLPDTENNLDTKPVPLKLLDQSVKCLAVMQIRELMSSRLPMYMVPSVWLLVEVLPFLVSGKLDRKTTANWVKDLTVDPYAPVFNFTPQEQSIRFENPIEDEITSIWSRVLNIPKLHVSLDESFLSLGGDSIAGLTCVGYCKKRGIGITVQDVLQSKSIKDLALRARKLDNLASYDEIVEKRFDLSPIQKLHSMVRKEGQGHFNQSVRTRLNQRVKNHDIRRSIETLITRHSMLRSRLDILDGGNLQQRVTNEIVESYRWSTHNVNSQAEIENAVASSQSCINAVEGPVLAVDVFDVDGTEQVLTLVAHHMVVDIVSWRIILEDLEDLLLEPHESTLQTGSLPFQTWCHLQADDCRRIIEEKETELQDLPSPEFAYWGMDNKPITYGEVDCHTFEVDADSTQSLLMASNTSLQTEPIDIFLASLLHSFHQTFKDRSLPVIYNEGHGREVWDSAIDISRTVGWFTILHPIIMQHIQEDDPVGTVAQVKDLRRLVTDNGRQNFARRMLGGEGGNHHCPMEISFNYVGQHRDLQRQDGLFQLINQMAGETGQGGDSADFGEDTPRFALFEISAMAVQGQLRFTFSFNRFMERQQSIRDWIANCQKVLIYLGSKLQSLTPRPTLSSFPMLSLTYEELKSIFSRKLPSIGIDSFEMVEDIYPCSRMQQGILLSRSRDQDLYAVHDTFEVKGLESEPYVNDLTLAWQQVVSHHAMLRTIFVDKLTRGDVFCQVVLKSYSPQPVVLHCENETDALLALEQQEPIRFTENQPPHRFTICSTAAGKLFCKIEINHVSMDGSSISIIMRDLELAYSGVLGRRRKPLFKNVLRYMRDQKDSTEYWCSYLENPKPCIFPVLNDGRQPVKRLRSTRLNVDFYNELLVACERCGVTLSTALSTAWGLTLRQFCSSDDVCFSYLASLRDMPVEDVESVVGPVITLLACRMRVSSNTELKDVLNRVQNDYMEHLSHRNTSLIDIQHALKLSGTALFNTGISYRKLPSKNAEVKGEIQLIEVGKIYDPAEMPIYINVEVSDEHACIDFNYWTTALSDGQAENVASVFLTFLGHIVYSYDKSLDAISALSSMNKRQIAAWNSKNLEDIDGCIHEVIGNNAKLYPNALALAAWDGELTYGKLNDLSTVLANYLTKIGVGPGVLVPLDFGKSMWQIVAVMAVLRAGGICAPLGREVTTENSYVGWLADNGAQVALVSPSRAHLVEDEVPYVVSLNMSLFEYLTDRSALSPVQTLDEGYVIFTAGQSSDDKAVVLNHKAILARAKSFASTLNLNCETRMFQFAPSTSDMFIQEVFSTLICGGCVCIPSDDKQVSLSVSINKFSANTLNLTPSIVSSIQPSDIPEVRCLSIFGENVAKKVRDTWSSKVELHAFYGTAECSSTCIHNANYDEPTDSTIGRSTNCNSWLVDPSDPGVLVPIGCIGELILEGPGNAHRYLLSEEPTREGFIKNPSWIFEFSNAEETDAGAVVSSTYAPKSMFKTGDLARYNADGTLVYVGRKLDIIDVGLHEVAMRMQHHADLALPPDCYTAIERIGWADDQTNSQDLAAFIFTENSFSVKPKNDRQIIAEPSTDFRILARKVYATLLHSFPSSHIPKYFFPVYPKPLTPSGKLDCQALVQSVRDLHESIRTRFHIKKLNEPGQPSSSLDAGTIYWKSYLSDIEPCLFPGLCTNPTSGEYGLAVLQIQNVAEIIKYSRDARVSIASLLSVTWGLVLRCYTGLEDVCFGHRTWNGTGLGGSDVVPCRMVLKDDTKVQSMLQNQEAHSNECVGYRFSHLDVKMELDLQDTLVFNTIFTCQESLSGNTAIQCAGTEATNPDNYMIGLNAKVSNLSGEIRFVYSIDCLSEAAMQYVVDCFKHILNSIISDANIGRQIGDIDFFSEKSCKRICEWNANMKDRPERCAHEVIREQVLALPHSAQAICSWDGDFTYLELDSLTDRLAQHLIDLGVGPEVFVALCFEKSAWYVIAQVAVLKAGGAFASLDPTHPEARLRGQVADIGSCITLCSSKHYDTAARISRIAIAVNESSIYQLDSPVKPMASPISNMNNAAYAVFTSGTTGKPKVTVLEHLSLGIAAKAFADSLRLRPGSRVIQFSSYVFDIHVLETTVTLMAGGCICIPSEDERMNDLSGVIRRTESNIGFLTPSTACALRPEDVPTLRVIAMGGEKMTANQVARFADRTIINAYGPSEAGMVSTASIKLDEGKLVDDDYNSIGTAFSGRAWVVDPHDYHRLVPVGAVGELILEGCNVGRGYLNNEEKTREAFICHPRWSDQNALRHIFRRRERMYRTGDLVRYRPDGSLRFISRKDTQIKLNGQRIELGEIEQQCVRFLPSDTQVAVEVVTPQARTFAKGLVLFFTDERGLCSANSPEDSRLLLPMDKKVKVAVEKLHRSLEQALPLFMIPKLFVPVRRIPIAVTGKLDRKGLRATVETLPKDVLKQYMAFVNTGSGRAAENEAESVLQSLWEEALGLATGSVNSEDSFFGIGGDSLSAMKLVGAAHARGMALTVADIYAHPTLVEMARVCEPSKENERNMSVEPFALLPANELREEIMTEIAEQCGIPKSDICDIYPCSPVQEGLLTLSIKQQGAYVARPIFKLTAKVDLERFKLTWQQAVREFEILRTRIMHTESMGFLQVVTNNEEIIWNTAVTVGDIVDSDVDIPTHNGGLLTGFSISQSDESSDIYFVWTIHHALYDGWSIPLILRRVEELYSEAATDPAMLPYKLFIRYLQEQDVSESDEFWKSQLTGVSSSHFPQNKASLDGVRVGNRHTSTLELTTIPERKDLTLPELIRAAWAIVISAYTGSKDVCFGETLMGRNIGLPGVTDIAGPVLTTVPTRIQVDNTLSITHFLQNMRKLTTDMIPHQHYGLQRIRKLNEDAAFACDFQNLLVIQTEDGGMNEDLWTPEPHQTNGDFFTHPLTVECKASGSKLEIVVHHDEVVLDSWQTERLTNQFIHVIRQLLTYSAKDIRKVDDIEVVSPQDKDEIALLNGRDPTRVERCVHDIIGDMCSAQPDAPAICAWDGQLSYTEMYRLASSFAAYLSSRGVGPETLVPICLDKSMWAVVTICAILIAGGAFVPLDPAHPTARHQEILEEVEAKIILCSPKYRNRYSRWVKSVIPVSRETIRAYSALTKKMTTSISATPTNMAYAIFTSGSTGRPKGIIIEHRALASSAAAFAPIVHLGRGSRAFQFASLTFDAAVLEVLATLMHGGCVCVPSEEERLNDVVGAIQRMNVTWSFLTPSVACLIEPSTVPSLKVLSCGGEKLSREVVQKWARRVKLINGYGPTETTIFAVMNNVTPSTDPACIGCGIPSTLTWIVDSEDHNRLAPLGAVGELALEGAALAREYLKSPKKTAEAFVSEPTWIKDFPSSLPSPRRIYKTGDLAKLNPDGSIEYISRKDHQVKINGLRMELGEIEHRLCEDPRVRHAVVILPKTGPAQKRLVAVLSLDSLASERGIYSDAACELVDDVQMETAGVELQEIQKDLGNHLPIYMVPQAWALIKTLPMLVSGKLDRKKITGWVESFDEQIYTHIMQGRGKVGQTSLEQKSQDDGDLSIRIVQDVLGQVLNISSDKVDPNRSFVSLGGDSITGMSVISRARKHGLSLALHNVLQCRSIAELALTSTTKVHVVHQKEHSGDLFDLSPIQQLYAHLAREFEDGAHFNQSMTIRVTKRTPPEVVREAIKAVVDRHAMFRVRFGKSQNGKWQQIVTKDIDSSYQFRTHSSITNRDMLPKIAESQKCLSIKNGPVLAADLFEGDGKEQVLFIVASHLCVDMVSWRIVLDELQEYIEAGTLFSDRTLSFQSWCEMQQENSKRENNIQLPFRIEQPNLAYWGMEKSTNVYGDVKMESFTVDEEATAFILDHCHKALRTETVEVLLSAISHSFRQVFTDRKVPMIYNEGHGRDAWDLGIDLSKTVGWFTTLCPLRFDDGSDFVETLKRVKDTRRKLTDDVRSYFARSLLHPKQGDLSSFPAPFEVIFNYLGRLQQLERGDALFQHYGDAFDAESFRIAGDMGPKTPRFALFEISAIVIKERLHVSINYNRNMQHESRIQNWISVCRKTLEETIFCLKDYAPEPTLSDYPLLPTSYHGLDDIVRKTLPSLGIDSWSSVEDIYPCSPVQEGILLSQLRDPHGYIFNAIFEVRPVQSMNVDPIMLQNAWARVIDRHSALRTLFAESNYKGGSFDQIVVKAVKDVVIQVECDDSLIFEALEKVKLQEVNSQRPIKLSQQLTICKTSSGRVFIKIEMNHAIIDGGSTDVLFRDLALAYNHKLPAGPGPRYSDYIKYTRGQMQSEALEHWKKYLSGARPCHLSFTPKPSDKRQLSSQMMEFNRFRELQKFCETHNVTLATLTLSAWAIVLRSFTGQDDICFGYPSAGRDTPVPGIHDAVGIFINMVCCRVQFTTSQTLQDIFRVVQGDYIESLPHQNCPLSQIQHESSHQGQSLFNTTLSIQNRFAPKDTTHQSISFDMKRAYDPTEYPVTVNVETTKNREGILLRYWTDSVSDSQAKDLADAIARVFACFLDSPSMLVSDLQLAPINPPQETSYPLADLHFLNSDALRKIIDNRVNEIISQMVKEGSLTVATVHSKQATKLRLKTSSGSLGSKGMSIEKGLTDSTVTLTNQSRSSTDTRQSTDLDKRLWRLWSSALGLKSDTIKYKASFFQLGGDSIAAMKMVGVAREEGVALSVVDVFSSPVFENMLAILKSKETALPTSIKSNVTQLEYDEKIPESPIIVTQAAVTDEISVVRPVPIDDTSLQASICSRIGVFRGGIADIRPVTDFQAMSLTASLFKSRWMLNYFFLDGKGPLDIRRLRESFLRAVDAFDILRTVFVCFHGQFFQVVLRKMKPEIIVQETENSLDEYTESLQQRDREQDPRQGEQYVQFYVSKKKGTDHHRILMRISHTQFDGVCLPRIMSAIKMGYEGSPIPPTSSFSNYMRMLPGSITPEHYQHWSMLLRGSKMTEIIKRQAPNNFQHIGSFTAQKKSIDASATVIGDVTLATVMQAAWAMTLAKLTAESDVVFGLTISGRNATIPGIESTVGPCLNMIPVRVKFGDRWTGLDLFRCLQDQHVANMPYESLGFREIIRNCTDWPDSTFFTTSVFHQNVEYEGHMQLDDNMYRMGGAGVVDNFTDITVVSKPTHDGKLGITLAYSQRSAITSDNATRILDLLSETAHSLLTNPNITLPSQSTLRSLPSQAINDLPRQTEEHFLTSNLNSRSISELLVHSDILNKSWQQVLPNKEPATAPRATFQLNSSFFGLGGDIFSMGQLAWCLEQEGLQVRLEELLEHPTFLGHLAVLALHNAKQEVAVEKVRSAASVRATSVKSKGKSSWNPLGKAVTLARRFSRWGSNRS
ncbi:nonribosomal peptide synthase Pes1 [Aspergillus avenaceus]|uniref:Nonribosomal peptide synthase Pes1 n=1 Tax=Aspergillus avenaceus TaxID=36643 RepID=A0A5N6U2F9_ASPAV|nr:nonribosomal peptide synthase Pes1 [Aspergillus avenaceus]